VNRALRIALVTLCLPVHACDTVGGGAVELSWKLRPASGPLSDKFVDCASGLTGPVTAIRLHWQVGDQPGSQAWACQNNHGVTGFDLPEGTAQLWVTPECGDGVPADPAAYISPAPIERAVTHGGTVSLGAVELIVVVSYCGPPMGSTQPCICPVTGAALAGDHAAWQSPGAPLAYRNNVKHLEAGTSNAQPSVPPIRGQSPRSPATGARL
jgi:hypothetical protein